MGSLTGMTNLCVVRRSALNEPAPADVIRRLLVYSDFFSNQLSGIIPSSLGSLTGMTWLCVPARSLPTHIAWS